MPLLLRSLIIGAIVPVSLALSPVAASASDQGNPQAKRIVAVGGTITEILYALGAGDRIVARDSTSSFPAEALTKPDIGYMRALSSEGILSQKPDLILSEDGAGPADVIGILKASEVPMVTVDTPPLPSAIAKKIEDVGAAVGLSAKAKGLADEVDKGLASLAGDVAGVGTKKKRVLFVLSTAGGRIMAAGKDTEAAAIIEMAGGINAAQEITGYKPLTDEAVIAAAPDVVLTMQRGNHAENPDQVFALPAFQSTPAAASKSLISMDGLYLIGFGPRTPAAGRELAAKLYPEIVKP
ncbi:heme/hemin ABC transporter substrate-binding protein [Agrobacterium rubi]|uniref:ABC transporter substrate-binding protein n=1 Tax=Agrobacterium rubi TaxID=28099 RepID=A0AAE7R0D1_9HYPH|nr:ABC transporter substrate-binding protein [Agrobacterium rubi]NTE87149.1 ABC transporter substrate-binding protein [Agrobacterium rubi]NTF03083.1 ABC transporter substrate-binding protein [Agrobacterium rubi]NTF37327.1 ABC transporter substrate-binding protein [Agrobacterium rubi]OCJ55113.1 hemin ABC transporter substrate-binding protein [Agrobacterium rubi]QTF99744.1 ABC transporter substrate-binding protein [Agrobacterium rubi]